MISIHDYNGLNLYGSIDFFGLSSDEKPIKFFIEDGDLNGETDVAVPLKNGSTFYEIDTQKMYMYDETNDRWLFIKQFGLNI